MNEKELLNLAMENTLIPCNNPSEPEEWARLGFFLGIRLLKKIRDERLGVHLMKTGKKEDGSPFTQFEQSIEDYCQDTLKIFYPEAGFIGEESESSVEIKEGQYYFLIDPIDGTRSFLSGFDSFALTICIVKGHTPLFSLIANPATGDMAFRIGVKESKMISLSFHSDQFHISRLPILPSSSIPPLLINIHPAKASKPYLDQLYQLWEKGKIAMVKSISGSPSWQVVQACKGEVIYFNTWASGITMPFDLVAAFHLLEGSGGIALNSKGEEINPWNHQGIFLMGVNHQKLLFLLKELNLK